MWTRYFHAERGLIRINHQTAAGRCSTIGPNNILYRVAWHYNRLVGTTADDPLAELADRVAETKRGGLSDTQKRVSGHGARKRLENLHETVENAVRPGFHRGECAVAAAKPASPLSLTVKSGEQ